MSEIIKKTPTEREIAVHAQLYRPNRHDKKHLTELGIGERWEGKWCDLFVYREIPAGTPNVCLVGKGDARFEEVFLGWVTVGRYDWIDKIEYPDGTVEAHPNLHFEFSSASEKLNIVAFKENHIVMKNSSQAAAFGAANNLSLDSSRKVRYLTINAQISSGFF